MKKNFQVLVVSIFLILLALPLAQKSLRFLPQSSLYNTTIRVPPIRLNFKNWYNGRMANWLERLLMRENGLYGTIIKINNTINYHLRVASPPYRGDVHVGQSGGLIHSLSLDGINGNPHVSADDIAKLVDQLSRLSKSLAEKDIPLIIALSPNKAIQMPELVPSTFFSGIKVEPVAARLLPLLKERGLTVVNISDVFQDNIASIYAKSGAHLNHWGACLAASSVSKALNPSGPMSCRLSGQLEAPSTEDRDLATLLNVFEGTITAEQQPEVLQSKCNGQVPKNTLFIGSSNLFGIIRALGNSGCIGDRDFYFYTSSHYYCRQNHQSKELECGKKPVRSAAEFKPKIFEGRSAVILEAPSARAHQLGFGMLKSLLGSK